MALNNNFPLVPKNVEQTMLFLRQLMTSCNFALKGKLNCTGTVTLTANAASTAVTDNNCLENSVILLHPTTANAAAAIATTYIIPASGSFIITHANNAQTDKSFRYAILG